MCNLIDGVDLYQNLNPPVLIRSFTMVASIVRIHQSAFLSSGRIAVSGGEDGTIYVWDPSSGSIMQTLEHKKGLFLQLHSANLLTAN